MWLNDSYSMSWGTEKKKERRKKKKEEEEKEEEKEEEEEESSAVGRQLNLTLGDVCCAAEPLHEEDLFVLPVWAWD